MSRSLFLLLAGIYGFFLAIPMLFFTESSLLNYGVPKVDLDHIAIMQYLGISNAMIGLLFLLNRNQPNSYSLCTVLLLGALNPLVGVVAGVYHVMVLNVPFSTFFVADTLFRLALGLAFLYYYNRESKAAGANAVLA